MASLVAKKKGHKLYYYLVESGRVGGKPRIVHQTYLGTAEKVAALVQDRSAPLPLEASFRQAGLPGLQRLPESSHACSSEVSHAKTLKSVSGKSGEGGTAPRQAQEALSGYGSTTSRIGCSRRAQPESSVIRAEGA